VVSMAEQLLQQLQSSQLPINGVIVTKTGHDDGSLKGSGIIVREASHPVPCEAGVSATQELIAHAKTHVDGETCVFVLLTGGGSSLLVAPREGLCLADLQCTSSLLLGCGADITELNCVRRALSAAKGGRLRPHLRAASRVCTLALSDVVGDDLTTIASGPTVPPTTTPADALAVLKKYSLLDRIVPAVSAVLQATPSPPAAAGAQADDPEATSEQKMEHFSAHVIGSNALALDAAATAATAAGFKPLVLSSRLEGEASQVACDLVQLAGAMARPEYTDSRISESSLTDTLVRLGVAWDAASVPPLDTPTALIFGGETTVQLSTPDGSPPGMGGRNQELALAAAVAFAEGPLGGVFVGGLPAATLLAIGTDGTDGPTDAAGGLVTCCTLNASSDAPLSLVDAKAALRQHSAYTALQQAGCLLKTGPTGTNVMDVTIVFLSPA